MRFFSRAQVEAEGRQGVKIVTDEHGTRARQLSLFWIYVDPEDAGYTKHALNDGFWEAWITLWMDEYVSEQSVCVDIGANHGYYSFFLAFGKKAKVYAFEPQPRLVDLIRKSEVANAISVHVEQVAISDQEGTTKMMVPVHHGMNATISNKNSYAPDGYEVIEVKTWALDSCFLHEKIDFIKVDAEGAEDLIWRGSKEFRARQPDCVWLMEWRWDRYENPEAFAQEILDEYDVTYVDFDSAEYPIKSVGHLETRQDSDWMLVLRRKK